MGFLLLLASTIGMLPSGVYAADSNDNDGDGVPDSEDAFPFDGSESIDTDRDGTDNNADNDDDSKINLLDGDSDNDGYTDGFEVSNAYDPSNPVSKPIASNSTTVYEDAEDGTIKGWNICDNKPRRAKIKNIYDDQRQSRVIHQQGKFGRVQNNKINFIGL